MKAFLAVLCVVAASMAAPAQAADAQVDFLAQNGKKDGWKTTADGLQYHQVKKSTDPQAVQAKPGATVTVHYEGKLIDGKVFDSSYARKEPVSFPLGNVIKGWQEGVPLMKVGDIYEFAIPSDLAYGPQGRPPVIPGGATLLFKVELIYVEPA